MQFWTFCMRHTGSCMQHYSLDHSVGMRAYRRFTHHQAFMFQSKTDAPVVQDRLFVEVKHEAAKGSSSDS